MWGRFWREYLGYPKKERRGIYVLLTILMLIAFYNIIEYQLWSTDFTLPTITVSPLDDDFENEKILRFTEIKRNRSASSQTYFN